MVHFQKCNIGVSCVCFNVYLNDIRRLYETTAQVLVSPELMFANSIRVDLAPSDGYLTEWRLIYCLKWSSNVYAVNSLLKKKKQTMSYNSASNGLLGFYIIYV